MLVRCSLGWGPLISVVFIFSHVLSFITAIFKRFFLMWTILKSLLNLLQYCFCFFIFWFCGFETCGIAAPCPSIELASPALEGNFLTTGPPGKSLQSFCMVERSGDFQFSFLFIFINNTAKKKKNNTAKNSLGFAPLCKALVISFR